MSEQLLNVLKLLLLAVLYLFFFRVLRAVWAEINPPKPRRAGSGRPPVAAAVPAAAVAPAVASGAPAATAAGKPKAKAKSRGRAAPTGQLVVVEPAAQRGRVYVVTGEITLGRAAGCAIQVDDTFVSQLHARVFQSEGNYVVDDLGSTNGTFLNGKKVSGPVAMQRGDRLQVGNTVLELE